MSYNQDNDKTVQYKLIRGTNNSFDSKTKPMRQYQADGSPHIFDRTVNVVSNIYSKNRANPSVAKKLQFPDTFK